MEQKLGTQRKGGEEEIDDMSDYDVPIVDLDEIRRDLEIIQETSKNEGGE